MKKVSEIEKIVRGGRQFMTSPFTAYRPEYLRRRLRRLVRKAVNSWMDHEIHLNKIKGYVQKSEQAEDCFIKFEEEFGVKL